MWQYIAILLVLGVKQAQSVDGPVPAFFYPFNTTNGDTESPTNDDGSSGAIPISPSFPFFGHPHNNVYVNTNGVVSFNSPVTSFTPTSFPLSGINFRLIAPFWGDVDTRVGPGRVFYRQTTDSAILNRATQEIDEFYGGCISNFIATWVFIATWCEVTYYYGTIGNPVNTFQAVLISNGTSSFVNFNYGDIAWTTGTASGGNSSGLGGTPAQVGFNAGDGTTFFMVDSSQTHDIINIEEKSNIDIAGRFFFRTDQDEVSGECNVDGDVRLVYGDNKYEGIAQMYLNGEWGYVCDHPGFTVGNWPSVFCNTLETGYVATRAKFVKNLDSEEYPDEYDAETDRVFTKQMPACSHNANNPIEFIDCGTNPNKSTCEKKRKKVVWVECSGD